MDVVIAYIGGNSLFHNNGNTNHWINPKLVGTASNRATIGAKVRIKATIGGKTFWQRRDIAGGGSVEGQSELRAGFGLGDATNIDIVRIEWPSGTVQETNTAWSLQYRVRSSLAANCVQCHQPGPNSHGTFWDARITNPTAAAGIINGPPISKIRGSPVLVGESFHHVVGV